MTQLRLVSKILRWANFDEEHKWVKQPKPGAPALFRCSFLFCMTSFSKKSQRSLGLVQFLNLSNPLQVIFLNGAEKTKNGESEVPWFVYREG